MDRSLRNAVEEITTDLADSLSEHEDDFTDHPLSHQFKQYEDGFRVTLNGITYLIRVEAVE